MKRWRVTRTWTVDADGPMDALEAAMACEPESMSVTELRPGHHVVQAAWQAEHAGPARDDDYGAAAGQL